MDTFTLAPNSLTPLIQSLPLEFLICSTLLLGIAWALTQGIASWSAATRHRIWFLAICGMAVLPFTLSWVPNWEIAVLVSPSEIESSPTERETEPSQTSASGTTSRPKPTPALESLGTASTPLSKPIESAPAASASSKVSQQTNLANPLKSSDAAVRSERQTNRSTSWVPPQPEPTTETVSQFSFWPIYIWGAVFLATLIPLVREFIIRNKILANSVQCNQESLQLILAEHCQALGFNGHVRLFESKEFMVPITWGTLRHTIVLPTESASWSIDRARAVLLHEVAHIVRRDVLIQIACRIICGACWFQPLGWLALKRLRQEREMACDDCVIGSGQKASDYAEQLIQLTQACQQQPKTMSVAIANTSNIEFRIQSLLNSNRSHRTLKRRHAVTLFLLTMMATVTISTFRLGYSSTPVNDLPSRATATENQSEQTMFHGRVFNANKDPAANVSVYLIKTVSPSHMMSLVSMRDQNEVVAQTKTSTLGEYKFAVSDQLIQQIVTQNTKRTALRIVAIQDDLATDWIPAYSHMRDFVIPLNLYLPESTSIQGRILDGKNNPVSGASIRVHDVRQVSLDNWIKQTQESSTYLSPGTNPLSTRELQEAGLPLFPQTAFTDSDGRFSLKGIGKDRIVTLELQGQGLAQSLIKVMTRKHSPVTYREWDSRYEHSICFGAEFEYVAAKEQKIFGLILDEKNGKPVQGVKVGFPAFTHESFYGPTHFPTATTDVDGKFVLSGVRMPEEEKRPLGLRLLPPKDQPYTQLQFARVPTSKTTPSKPLQIKLKNARWLTGKLKNLKTGEPVQGRVAYFPFSKDDDPERSPNPSIHLSMIADHGVPTDADGSFRIQVLPGLGIVTGIADKQLDFKRGICDREYLLPDDQLTEWGKDGQLYHMVRGPQINIAEIVDINPIGPVGSNDLELIPESTKLIRFRDSQGVALTGVKTVGIDPHYGTLPNESIITATPSTNDSVVLRGLDQQKRWVLFFHPERNLGKVIMLNSSSKATVVLEPCAKIVGRINAEHWTQNNWRLPFVRMHMDFVLSDKPGPLPRHGGFGFPSSTRYRRAHPKQSRFGICTTSINEDGTFEMTSIPPGARYKFWVNNKLHPVKNQADTQVPIIKPGETIDTGSFDARYAFGETPKEEQPKEE